MPVIFPMLIGFLFLGAAILGFVVFLAGGDTLGAIFFSLGFVVGSAAWFAVAAKVKGVKLGSLPDAFRAVFGRGSDGGEPSA